MTCRKDRRVIKVQQTMIQSFLTRIHWRLLYLLMTSAIKRDVQPMKFKTKPTLRRKKLLLSVFQIFEQRRSKVRLFPLIVSIFYDVFQFSCLVWLLSDYQRHRTFNTRRSIFKQIPIKDWKLFKYCSGNLFTICLFLSGLKIYFFLNFFFFFKWNIE